MGALILAAGSMRCPPLMRMLELSRRWFLVFSIQHSAFCLGPDRVLSITPVRIRVDPCKSVAHFAFPSARANIAMRMGTAL